MKTKMMTLWIIGFMMLSAIGWASDPNYLIVEPVCFSEIALEDGENPAAQTMKIHNTALETLDWSIVDVGEMALTLPDWLDLSPVSGSLEPNEIETVSISVDASGLSGGLYSYTFNIGDLAVQSKLQTVTVDVEVIGSQLDISSETFTFSVYEEGVGSRSQTLIVSNPGGGILNWAFDLTDKPDWLTLSIYGDTLAHNETSQVIVSVNTEGLSGGQYTYTFQASDSVAENSPQTITIDLEVVGPIIGVSKTQVSFICGETDNNPQPQQLTITNKGGGILDWYIAPAVLPDWLSVAPEIGSLGYDASENIVLSVDANSVSLGQHDTSFQIVDLSGQAASKTIQVTLSVMGVIYVDVHNAGDPDEDGSEDHPYDSIQGAIDVAVMGNIVKVMPGVYYEQVNIGGKNRLTLTSSNPDDPNVVAATIINGGESRFGIQGGIGYPDNVIQGFTITNCDCGVYGTDATIRNCTITGNIGGFNCETSGLFFCRGTIINCTISENINVKSSGILYLCGGSIINCTISDNIGNAFTGCDGRIENCTVRGNVGHGFSGCLSYGSWVDDPAIINCVVSDNTGSGFYYCSTPVFNCIVARNWQGGFQGCENVIANCTIIGNHLNVRGPALCNCTAEISNCIIWGNVGLTDDQLYGSSVPQYSCIQNWTGGGTGNIDDDPRFVDAVSDNVTQWDCHLLPDSVCVDAGLNLTDDLWPDTDIEGNSRPYDGDNDGSPVADMGAYESHVDPDQAFLHIISQRGFSFAAFEGQANISDQVLTIQNLGVQNLSGYPDVTHMPTWLNVSMPDETLAYRETSDIVLSVDAVGLPIGRHIGSFDVFDPNAQNSPQAITVELVVVSVPEKTTYYVDDNGPYDPNLVDGTVLYPFRKIQDGIDAAQDDEIVMVLPGRYDESIHFNGKNIILTSIDPQEPTVVEETVIDAFNYHDSVVYFFGTETPDCVLQGFTITGGRQYFDDDWDSSSRSGGGICGNGTNVTIRNCRIIDNVAARGAGLAYCHGEITNCTVSQNKATNCSAGLYCCNGPITNCIISANRNVNEYGYGGAVADCDGPISGCIVADNYMHNTGPGMWGCDGLISDCLIMRNRTNSSGAGLIRCNGVILNCLIMDNYARSNGGGLYGCDGSIINCSIMGNRAGRDGGGMCRSQGSVINNIIWDNLAENSGNQLFESSTPKYSCIQDWTGGGLGNISDDPLFVDALSGDYHLKSAGWRWDVVDEAWTWDDVTSPCIDAGNPGMPLGDEPITLDADPMNRWGENIRINMGAYGGTPEASMAPPGWALLCDLDNSGNVNLSDFATLAAAWMQTAQNQPPDVNRDGIIDLEDLMLLTDDWLE